MSVRPARLNSAIAWLFIVGSACFVLGSVPAYLTRSAERSTASRFRGLLFFTSARSASSCRLRARP